MAMVSKYLWLTLVLVAKGGSSGRKHLRLILGNELRVVLISDPTTEMAGAAMSVDVGAIVDPKEMQGLAHFCEHMLFMSRDKEFIKHVDGVGGVYNAFTGYEETNLHFAVPHQHLETALHRFSQLFINPSFEEGSIEGVVQEIDSEFLGRLNGDREREALVRKTYLNSSHPFSYFGYGNYKSLYELPKANNISPQQLLTQFYTNHYSANLMNLAVVGHEPIQVLKEMVVHIFSEVSNRNLVRPSVPDSPFLKEDRVQVTIEPTRASQTMILQFDLPSQKMHFREKPLQYILYFINHEGPGSLMQLLKGRGWVASLSINADNDYFDFCLVGITLELTGAGFENRHAIVKLFFEYVDVIQADGVTNSYFKEIATLQELNFNHQERGDVMEEVSNIARDLRTPSPLATALKDAKLITEFNATLITDTLAYFTPSHLRLHIIAALPNYNQTEPWANVSFTKDSFVIANPTGIPLTLPELNPFIPTNFTLIPTAAMPRLLVNSSHGKLWYGGKVASGPRASIRTLLKSELINSTPEWKAMAGLIGEVIRDELSPFAYIGNTAGLEFRLEPMKRSMAIIVEGYSHHIEAFNSYVLARITSLHLKRRSFDFCYEKQWNEWQAQKNSHPIHQGSRNVNVALSTQEWPCEAILNTNITLDSFTKAYSLLISTSNLEMLVIGNLDAESAKRIFASTAKAILPRETCAPRTKVRVPLGNYVHQVYASEDIPISSIVFYLEVCQDSECPYKAITKLLADMLHQFVYWKLRMEEQLAYMASVFQMEIGNRDGISIAVLSKYHPVYLESRIERMLKNFTAHVNAMPSQAFQNHLNALKQQLTSPLSFKDSVEKTWDSILTSQYDFSKDDLLLESLSQMTPAHVVDFLTTHIIKGASHRRKFSTHILAANICHDKRDCYSLTHCGHLVSDLVAWRQAYTVPA